MKVALIQQANGTDIKNNMKRLAEKSRSAAKQGAKLVVLQELQNSIYFCQSENTATFDLAEPVPGFSTNFYSTIAKRNRIVLVVTLFERRAPGLYHNTAAVFDKDGSLAGRYRKMHIPDDPGYYEKFYFAPGDMGFKPIRTSLGVLGVQICWDQWYPEGARIMALRGAEILIYPTAIGWDPADSAEERKRQLDSWIAIQRGHAVANGLPLVAVNRCGFESDVSGQTKGIDFWGNSFACGPQGEMLFEAGSDESVDVVDIDLNRCETVRRVWPFLRDRRIDAFQDIACRYSDKP
ncbi:MAG TPA: carbon-nitrogen hydrolase [Bacteroidaceae bacterium]|nr:carbon-nitrogen hydrolase [Bacteroidaceae bacterium]